MKAGGESRQLGGLINANDPSQGAKNFPRSTPSESDDTKYNLTLETQAKLENGKLGFVASELGEYLYLWSGAANRQKFLDYADIWRPQHSIVASPEWRESTNRNLASPDKGGRKRNGKSQSVLNGVWHEVLFELDGEIVMADEGNNVYGCCISQSIVII